MLLNGVLVILFKTVVMLNEIQHKGSSIVEEVLLHTLKV